MNEITRMYNDNPLRVINRDGEPWFVAKDVADILGYGLTTDMTRRLDDDEKGMQITHTPGGKQEMIIINEPGLYAAIMGSQKPEAKDFKRWVTHDVLPSIRKTGSYTVPQNSEQITDKNLQHIAEILKSAAEIAKENSVLSERNSYLSQFAPTSDYGDPNRDGNPRYQKRRGYFVSNRGADVAKRDPEKYGYQQDLFYDRLPQILMESFTSAVKRLAEGE
jgi:anti-repressor protein